MGYFYQDFELLVQIILRILYLYLYEYDPSVNKLN